jgi:hypothetical protein
MGTEEQLKYSDLYRDLRIEFMRAQRKIVELEVELGRLRGLHHDVQGLCTCGAVSELATERGDV